jgi:methylenetetrahydrofolate reductase (NADPH)
MSDPVQPPEYASQFEVLPIGRGEEEAARLPEPVRLTVICSPKHGPDRSVEVARNLAELGHGVTVHLAARMIRDSGHLDALLEGMAEAGADDLFLIGGDASPPDGPYSSALDLLPEVAEHPRRPREIGIAGYPEGHPLIDSAALADALEKKSEHASYITTQLCFDPDAVIDWVGSARDRGIGLPVFVGLPGVVDRRKLLEISMRIGVGPSLAFLRKQRGLRSLLGRSSVTPDEVYDGVLPHIGDRRLNIAGYHYYTFNQLLETWRWECRKTDRSDQCEEVVTT